MKKFLLGSIALVALNAGSALAADMARPVYKAAPPPPICIWCGFYLGGNVGVARTRANVYTTNAPSVPGIFGAPANIAAVNAAGTGSLDDNTFFTGGVQGGYNWQVSPNFLLGIEADINSLRQTSTLANVAATTIGLFPVTTSLQTDWLATVRGRAGVTFGDTLIYVTGGAAFTKQTLTQTAGPTVLAVAGATTGTSSTTSTKTGWTVGAGWEQMLWGAWSFKAEYLYAHFSGFATATTVTSTGGFTQFMVANTDHLNVSIARVGLNYHFGGPVVARY
jgi:outer membrane immunogenic protein